MRDRWAVILAGGDGTRLQSMTRAITGDNRPKQFVPVIGGATLLDQTRRRVALSVIPGRTFIVVTKKHQQFYNSHWRNRSRQVFCFNNRATREQHRRFSMPCCVSRQDRRKPSWRCSLPTITSLTTKNSCRISILLSMRPKHNPRRSRCLGLHRLQPRKNMAGSNHSDRCLEVQCVQSRASRDSGKNRVRHWLHPSWSVVACGIVL
jgi:hypothetical protein